MEEWKDIVGYEGYYQVSSYGRVRSLDRQIPIGEKCRDKTGQMMAFFVGTSGYYTLQLKRNSKRVAYMVHRLVAKYFIPNPDNKPQVNHKDGNKLNNHFTNLEWCDQFENVQHAFRENLHSGKGRTHYKAKKITCTESGKIFDTLQDAADYLGVNKLTLWNKLSGRTSNNTTLTY